MKLLLDQNLSAGATGILRAHGIEAVHAREVGLECAEDEAILDWCRATGRLTVTLDADFHTLLAVAGARSPSVVRIRIEGLRDDDLAKLIMRVIDLLEEDLARGIAVSVTTNAIRIRSLPLA